MTVDTSCCAAQPCGCCDGVTKLTPVSTDNRPGLDSISYRVGTHGQFLETMKARISTMSVSAIGGNGQLVDNLRPLQGLTTRDCGDLSIALLDGWATVADVLTFYQERIANEGYLRTATERRSVLELAYLVGYALRPGVAATVYLAYTVDEKQVEPVTIPAGASSQSVPAPGESPQKFETSEDLVARSVWNNLQVRVQRPQCITLGGSLSIEAGRLTINTTADAPSVIGRASVDVAIEDSGLLSIKNIVDAMVVKRNALAIDTISVAGTATGLKLGDKLLLVFRDDETVSPDNEAPVAVVRTVASIDTLFENQRTAIALQPIARGVLACAALLAESVVEIAESQANSEDPYADALVVAAAQRILNQCYLGLPSDPSLWVDEIRWAAGEGPPSGPLADALTRLQDRVDAVLRTDENPDPVEATDPKAFVSKLLIPKVPQVASGMQLRRNLDDTLTASSDTSSQLLVRFAPALGDNFYRAWSGARVNDTVGQLQAVYAFRSRTSLFGAGASKIPTEQVYPGPTEFARALKPQNEWNEWPYADDEQDNNAFLDQANDAILPGSYVLAHVGGERPTRQVLKVAEASVVSRSEYGLSGPSTSLVFEGNTPWRATPYGSQPDTHDIATLRKTQIYAQSELLSLVEEAVTDWVDGQEVELSTLYGELKSGRWVILSGERADIPGVGGVRAAELLMISGLRHGFDASLPGDQMHTTLIFATPTAYSYKRDKLVIYGNVVKATHGETRNEVLGSGDGRLSLQSFTLKQPPLTFVPAPNAAGTNSTLRVNVDNVEWNESDSLTGQGSQSHTFVTSNDDAGNTRITFGNGVQGARLPSGVQNVTASYRSGIGAGGNVKAGQVSLLQTRPLGVTAVVNPLRASGGADKESRDLARENVPLSIMPLDRLVSMADYAAFVRNFAGIAKAVAWRVSDRKRQVIHLTIAGADDVPIDSSSDLCRNLLVALRTLGDPELTIRVDARELIALFLSAGVKLLAGYSWEPVANAIRARLLEQFGFGKRSLGQAAMRCEIIGTIQNTPGVAYVDVDAFGGIPEKQTIEGRRELLGFEDIARIAKQIIDATGANSEAGERVDAFPGGMDHGLARPAQLAIFTPSVPDTLILNQLL